MPKSNKPASLHIDYLDIDGRTVPVTARHNPRARRIIVRVDLAAGSVQVTSPSRRGMANALKFAHEQREWIAERLEQVPPPVPFKSGARIPFRGKEHLIRHIGTRRAEALGVGETTRGPVWRVRSADTGGLPEIRVTGHPDFVQRRVTEWLKTQARLELNEKALGYAEMFDVRPSRITMRDQTSRWGSCSPSRALSFSWRLVMAPGHVLDYVAAHEVAHLRHMNHGPRFWALVREAIPNFEPAKNWLEIHGPGLHRYGADPFADIDEDED
jgi:predicted metal-dependent hydrolase